MQVWYADTSAVVKLVEPETETPALRAWLRDRRWVISDLHRTELRRATLRAGPDALARAEHLLDALDLITLSGAEYDRAGRLGPPGLRSLDALHLSVAQALGPDCAGVVSYDRRLLDAAEANGIPVASPA